MDLLILAMTQGASFSPISIVHGSRLGGEGGHRRPRARQHLGVDNHRQLHAENVGHQRESEKFERDFWASSDIDGFFGSTWQKRPARRQGVCRRRRRMAALDQRQEHRPRRHARTAGNGDGRDDCGRNRQARQPVELSWRRPDRSRLCRAVRHGLGHHAQFCGNCCRAEFSRSRSSRPALPRHCSQPPSACLRPFRRSSPITVSRTG